MRHKDEGAKPKQIRAALDTIELISGGDPQAWMRATIVMISGVVIAALPEKPDWNPLAASKGPQKMAVVFFPALIEELKKEN